MAPTDPEVTPVDRPQGPQEPKPSPCRIVLYKERQASDPLPAVILRVHSPDCVDLEVFGPIGDNLTNKYPTSVTTGGSLGAPVWFWPPRS